MTLVNYEEIPIDLKLDLRGEDENPEAPDGIECLQVISLGANQNDESILKSVHNENMLEDENDKGVKGGIGGGIGNDMIDLDHPANDSDDSEEEDHESAPAKLYHFTV